MARPTLTARVFSRRSLLRDAAIVAGGTSVLPGCDVLKLPDEQTLDEWPPITDNETFYITNYAGVREVDAAAWTLKFLDRGELLAEIDLAYLESLPGREKEHTLQCIGSSQGNQAIGNAIWTGLPLPELLAGLGVTLRADALQVKFTGDDGYETSLPRETIDKPMWLVWKMNGVPLPKSHGFPARMLVPGRYGTKNPKWLTALELIDEPFIGFWEDLNWSDSAIYRPNTFVRQPQDRATVVGPAVIIGTAFAGEDAILRVEYSSDDGATWQPAEITYQNGPSIWTLWRFDFDEEAGDYSIIVRCTTHSGAQSMIGGTGNLSGYNGSMAIDVTLL